MHRTEGSEKAVGAGEMQPCTVALTLQLSTASSGHGEEDKDLSGRFPMPQCHKAVNKELLYISPAGSVPIVTQGCK